MILKRSNNFYCEVVLIFVISPNHDIDSTGKFSRNRVKTTKARFITITLYIQIKDSESYEAALTNQQTMIAEYTSVILLY